ncbi:hypothetical protein CAFE_29750 [Caprobacter fermentans]|uniref:Uncharacterized protein n=1 Tax=Caproicibacter fermentans TaxID=2576756 RepID=A0A6N8I416_9FIRM|nr:hypothetical protein [Caproicibacter fermentans]MVB12243.1 hypothetical protein [Caproicibacter fermentans]OCN01104.1 hypothetical protein A7X67_06950 [Clostridium sp. W14A]
MNLKPIIRMQCRTDIRVFRIMYLVVYCIVALNVFYELFRGSGPERLTTSGLETATVITIFIVGLNSFREFFLFYSANGVSRRRMLAGIVSSLGIAAACTALIDTFNMFVFSLFMNYRSVYSQSLMPTGVNLKFNRVWPALGNPAVRSPAFLLKNLLWCFCLYFVAALLGLLITTFYYRLTRTQKFVCSFGVPVVLLIGLPVFDQAVTGGRISAALAEAFRWWMNCAMNPAADFATHMILAAFLAALTFLLVRRVEIKR